MKKWPVKITMYLTEHEKEILTHTLTGSKENQRPYRNYYAASKGHDSMPELENLLQKGLMKRGQRYSAAGRYYHCTEAGAYAVGLYLPRER